MVQMIVKDDGYKYFAARATCEARLCPHSARKHTHTPPKRTLSA